MEGGRRKPATFPNSLQKRQTLILVLPVSFQVVSLFWEAVGTPGYMVKAVFLYPPSFIVPPSWARRALVKPFQHLIPGQHQSLGTDLRLNLSFPHCNSHPHTKHLFACTNQENFETCSKSYCKSFLSIQFINVKRAKLVK